MKSSLVNPILALAAGVALFAAPGQATPFLSFSTSSSAGSTFVLGSSGNGTFGITSLSVLFTGLSVAGDGSLNGSGTLTHGDGSGNCTNAGGATMKLSDTNTLQLWGAVTGISSLSNLSSGCNLLLSLTDNTGGWTGTATGSSPAGGSGTVNLLNTNLISVSSTILSDLSLTQVGSTVGNGSGITGTSSTGNGHFNAVSEQLTLNLISTPEPVSFLLMGAGLGALILMARKRSAAV